MDMGLKNKTALVTGSTKGIGKAIAIELAKEGVHVLINGRNEEEAERTVNEIKSAFPATSPQNAAADIVDIRQREALFKKYPQIDILVNNMGIYEIMEYENVDDEVWEKYFRTNVLAANGLTKFYLPKMLKSDFGRIIFIASEEAMMPSGQMPQYCMTKSMLLSLAKSLSKLTIGTEVTVNTIMPGPTLSENVKQIIQGMYPDEGMTFSEKEKKFMTTNLPQSEIQRFIKPIEIGRLAAFVCSPYASAFKGSPIRMDGGMVPTIF
ncbi:SDR family NAD(P)-dependent oxidoreductase [Bacillus sp. GM2]|uniref:SDR family NAD(P)-dependent oxidoreductase n=1 Tax=Bacillus TaxID=1386 RepID=UPI0009533473|nr:SDR family oxidoreductase [Bacillus paralicheniformis]MSN97604.1 SDR family NAD(P)-dependent oxidoreductase [Bacillus paralicheniformis]MSO01613.1 SDR family NAD(P)-dependent oxidoreductase [Bacillus paralicheniformis]MSO05606.1 SDR family NAD(P)-dependent oxidoreductase [Bacillus paralicheniformis]MSO09599.1 SDR family NAD(P)-dependent oxidoreductase [Bacillus paralicheniformis]NJE37835.1 SDR family oxidoreductase [Bacillus paralicheniformis]